MTSERGPELIESARNVGVLLTCASALSYASGYVALRARSHALGTDPGFTLVDQAYVFAGFRFALDTLVALLVVAPLLMLLRATVRALSARLKPQRRLALAWVAAIALAVATLASFATLEVKAVLLGAPVNSGPLQRALARSVLGYDELGVPITLAATFGAALTVLWARARYREAGPTDALAWVLTLMSVLQLVLLPVQHGIFYADRSARMLARVPEGLAGVSPPVWLLDRGADRASLIVRGADGRLALITVKVEALDGIPVTRTVSIGDVVRGGGAP